MVAPLDIDAIRAQIPATRSLVYLNTGWQGPSPLSITKAVRDTFELEAEAPTAPPVVERRLAIFRRARQALAELVNVSPAELTLQQNTTEGINIVLNGLALGPEDEIITCSLEHPSVIIPFYYARQRRGARLKIVRLSAADSPAAVLAKFEEAMTPSTRLLVLSHVAYGTGQLLPVPELSQLAHESGAYLLLDAAQSVGQLPVDLRQLDCDFGAFPTHKWLLGPAGCGALYVRQDLIEGLEPPRVAHHAVEYYNFRGDFRPKGDTIDKFELTTVSVPLLAGLVAAVEFVQAIGLERIRDRCLELARYATAGLSQVPDIRLVSAREECLTSGLVSFALPRVSPQIMTACLWEQARVVARTVPDAGCTRLSLHVFNTEAEVDAAVAVVEELARTGSPDRPFPSVQLEWDAMVEL